MTFHTHFRLNRHHKFERGGRKYVADLETHEVIELNAVEWDILDRYATQTHYQIVEGLKEKYKIATIFDGIERLERLGQKGSLLSPVDAPVPQKASDRKRKVLVPFHFTKEKTSLDYLTNLNRYQLLTHLAQFADLETLTFSEGTSEDFQGLGAIRTRNVDVEAGNAFAPPWHAMDGYDGVCLLSQFVTDDLLCYRGPDVPIVHAVEDSQQMRDLTLEMLLNVAAFQNPKDTLVVRSSWVQEWLTEYGFPEGGIRVIPNGINVSEPIGKPLAKQHTAALFEKPMFATQPVVGLISGFEPNAGAKLISAFARANPQLAIFVYDLFLAEHWAHPPDNVVVFSADDAETHSVLPIFFQALDLVCFPAILGTPLSLVLEAMAYGTPCVALTKYGLPPEVAGAGGVVKSEWSHFGDFRVSLSELSDAVNQWLQPSAMRAAYETVARGLAQTFTWAQAAQAIVRLFEDRYPQKVNVPRAEDTVFPSVFCRRYDPATGNTASSVYRLGTNRYDCLKTALAEMLAEQHTPVEVESVFKHFRWKPSA